MAAAALIDCSEKICNIYCPRWCLTALSPPPQPPGLGSTTTVPPVIIALIVLLVAVFVAISCYGYVCIYLGRRRAPQDDAEAPPSEGQASEYGLDDFVIKSITVFQFRKSDKLVEGTECSVCLCEFEEGENLRLLPKCCHAFHPQCIDTWLKSNSSCPLCRAGVNPYSPVNPNSQSSAAINVYSLEVQRNQSEFVVMVEDDTRQVMEVSTCDDQPKDSEEGQFRRSISPLGSFSSEGRLLVADIARSDGYGVRRSYSNASFDTTLHDRA